MPYDSKTVRVPVPLVFKVEEMCDRFREAMSLDENLNADILAESLTDKKVMEVDEAIEQSKKILKSKKGAAESLAKLLQILYGREITKENLK